MIFHGMKERPKILVIDANSEARKTLSDILTEQGCEVFSAKDGADGLAEVNRVNINLALIDLNLPDIPGIEMLHWVKSVSQSIEVIVQTEHASLESAIEATNKGAFSYLLKPYEPKKLLLHIQRALDKRQAEWVLQLFRNLINQSNDAIYVIEPETGFIEYVNDKVCSNLGYTRKELLGMGVLDINPVVFPDRLFWEEHVKRVQEKGHMILDGAHKRKDGTTFPVEVSVKYVTEDNKDYMIAVARDITERKRAEEELKERDENISGLKHMMDFSTLMREEVRESELVKHMTRVLKDYFRLDVVAVLMPDREKGVLEVPITDPPIPSKKLVTNDVILDPSVCRVLRTGQEFVVRDIKKDPPCEGLVYGIKEGGYVCLPMIAGGNTVGSVLMIKAEEGYWEDRDKHKLMSAYVGLAASAIDRVRLLHNARSASITDALTGLYNRRFFDEILEKQLALSKRHTEPLGILIMDVDHFKGLNDTYGHTIGDKALQRMSKVLRDSIRSSDVLCRYGGEEFVIIMPSMDITDAVEKAEQIRSQVESFNFNGLVAGKSLKMTISIGVASTSCMEQHSADYDTLVGAADSAMYKAKRGGRNRVEAPSSNGSLSAESALH